jgi:hypothetical protein
VDAATDSRRRAALDDVYGNIVKARARGSTGDRRWIDQPLGFPSTRIRRATFSSGDDVHFFKADARAETGRLADVVYHEFGHSLHATRSFPVSGVRRAERRARRLQRREPRRRFGDGPRLSFTDAGVRTSIRRASSGGGRSTRTSIRMSPG